MDIPSLIANFQKEIQDVEHSEWDIIKRSQKAIALSRKVLVGLKTELARKDFGSMDQEIQFFKVTKQIPLTNLIYYLECYAFEAHFPKIGEKQQQKHIAKTKDKIQMFFNRHAEFINYMGQGCGHLDIWYFTRQTNNDMKVVPEQDYTFDMDFSAPYDMLLGKLYAYERFIKYLEGRLGKQEQETTIENLGEHYNLKWTSSKTALTELIYALYYSRAINHGNIDKRDIAMVFQKLFNLDLGDFYKTLSEIKSRKKSRTRFLDELSMGFIYEMEKSER
ncbi:RteC domain-containing protein [Snuella lapsa]|uniref:RteC domain-containing protein n=1 Tax=Snuella lapsa TaxID=870481 RepID=A0ABP6WPN9_9FLAO